MRFNSITVAPVRSLESGDLIAHELVGTIVSGVVTRIVSAAYSLNDAQRQYMLDHNLEIPENEYADIAGAGRCLVFGNFRGHGMNKTQPSHMYIGCDVNVAVFPYKRKYSREVSHDKLISPVIADAGKYKEVAIGDCAHGCKIYEHDITGERVLAHNSAYGCRL